MVLSKAVLFTGLVAHLVSLGLCRFGRLGTIEVGRVGETLTFSKLEQKVEYFSILCNYMSHYLALV